MTGFYQNKLLEITFREFGTTISLPDFDFDLETQIIVKLIVTMCHRRVTLPLLKWSKILPRTSMKILNTLRRKLVMTYFLNLFKLVLNLLLHGWMKELNSLNFANLRWKNFQFVFHNFFLLIFFFLYFQIFARRKETLEYALATFPDFISKKA